MMILELILMIGLALVVCAGTAQAESYGNFNTMGVVVGCPEGRGPLDIGCVKAFLVQGETRSELHDFVRVASAVEPRDYYATSVFHLQPDTEYVVDIEYYDRDGDMIAALREQGRTRPEPRVPETSRSLFVSPGGSDENPGTLERPLRTLKAAFAALRPDTTLFLRGGTYYEGNLSVSAGGSGDAPIVIRGYQDEKAVIDCSDPELASGTWQAGGDGVYSASLAEMSWNVTLEDRETGKHYRAYPLRTREELMGGESAGMSFDRLGFTGVYHHDGGAIHIRVPQAKVDDYEVHVARFAHAIVVESCNSVFIEGIEIRYSSGSAIHLDDTSDCLLQHLRVLYCNEGVHIKGDSSNNTIQDSFFFDDVNHWDFEYVKTDAGWSYYRYIETGAVSVDARYSGRGLVFRRNHVEGLFDGVHLCPWVECNARTSETDFYDNEVIEIADDFIETDGYSRNVRIFGNRMDKALTGVSLAQALDGPTWVLFNVIANCGVCSGTRLGGVWGYPIKMNGGDGYLDVGTGTVLLYHNTSYTSDPDGRAFLVKQAMWRNLVFRNNIWCGKIAGLVSFHPQIWPVEWDYDDIYRESGPLADMGGFRYETIDELRSATAVMPVPRFGRSGFGAHLMSREPRFVSPDAGDYRLRPDSPCIDAGVVIPGINDGHFRGEAPDMGAFESEQPPSR
jgi:hypothetical protein